MTALAQQAESEFDELAEFMADIVAPELTWLIARAQVRQAAALIADLDMQGLYALAVVLADRCRRVFEGERSRRPAVMLARAVRLSRPAEVAAILSSLDLAGLRDLVVELGAFCPFPTLRPEDGIVDEVAVHRAAAGEPVLLTSTERDLAIRLMHRRGVDVRKVRAVLAVSGSTVLKVLATPMPVQAELFEEIA